MDFNKIKEMGLEYAEKGKNAAMDLAERGRQYAAGVLRQRGELTKGCPEFV